LGTNMKNDSLMDGIPVSDMLDDLRMSDILDGLRFKLHTMTDEDYEKFKESLNQTEILQKKGIGAFLFGMTSEDYEKFKERLNQTEDFAKKMDRSFSFWIE